MKQTIATITEILDESTDIKRFILELDQGINPKAGQYVMIATSENPQEKHAFSIVSYDPLTRTLDLCIKKEGRFTSLMFDLSSGKRLLVFGPYGTFTIMPAAKTMVMIAGGIGITPLYNMAKSVDTTQVNVHLLYSARTKEAMALLKEVSTLDPAIDVRLFFSDEACDLGEHRRISIKDITSSSQDLETTYYYFCGPPRMIDYFCETLAASGIREEHLRREDFKNP